jgi:transcription-repair coupling factor (superfamily II helicase)
MCFQMNLFYLDELLERNPEFGHLTGKLIKHERSRISLQLAEQAYGYLVSTVFSVLRRPVIFITAHPESARRRIEQVKLWLKPGKTPYLFPEMELLSNTAVNDPVINSEKLKILSMLAGKVPGIRDVPFIVASALALAGKCISNEEFQSGTIEVKRSSRIAQSALLEALQKNGYEYEEVVEIPGAFAKRGGIVDIFPAGREQPVRIEFFGDEVESIREYDAKTQRSQLQVEELVIPPARDQAVTSTSASLLDYLPADTIVFLDDPAQVEAELEKIEEEAAGLISTDGDPAKANNGLRSSFSWQEIKTRIGAMRYVVELSQWDEQGSPSINGLRLHLKPAPGFAGRFPVFVEQLAELRRQNSRVMIVSQQADRVKELLLEHGIETYPSHSLEHIPPKGSLTLVQGPVEGGWHLDNELLLFTDNELFGIFKQRRSVKTRPVRHHWFLNDINTGDLVVHVEHGIGRFAGTTRKVSSGIEREYLVLEYAGGDTLYVPVEQVDRVNLYIGGGERTPSLNRLGTQEWNRARQKVKDSVANIAGELIELYAKREAGGGVVFPPDTLWQKELEASFPYVETIDQLEALKSVKQDMESARPMDRLVCGDVGYGKTEIAVRAAFKAVMDGKQVALLVPTTILAQQHMNTFSERLSTFPVKVAALSRFCSHREQLEVIGRLKEGNIDICIGTHRILQKDVQFKDLGLVIIDEEQRFGVVHKEHFKKMRQSVDVLTLSATPIPRTMHMALSGIRDMSTIETPPENRLPINTFVGEFNERVVREAILREMERDGQVFLVHNRVHSIGSLAYKLKELVPEAGIAVAHGQMDEDELECIMSDFMAGKNQVLVTTTIIESGLDMPNVNTLIVDNADKLGLTQLYQLRGRVGRGANSAYAYFLFDSGKMLTEHARERLKTIAQATELGAGFAIAMKDLEIRGAGNLLGVEQSGNIAAVGFSYYTQLLAEAVEEIKARRAGKEIQKKAEEPAVSIDLKLTAYIAQDYIENTRSRFNIYQRLAKCNRIKTLEEIEEELTDRFGDIPEETANLLYMVKIKMIASGVGIESIFNDGDRVILSFKEGAMPDNRKLVQLRGKALIIGNRQIRIDLDRAGPGWKELLRQLLENLNGHAAVS